MNTKYRNEVKEGFLVPSILKRSWYAQMEILSYIDKICKENNIKYFADWGTLLGAIRHKGFIPWDDDIDLGMLRDDYNRFKEVIVNYPNDYYRIKYFQNTEGFTDFKILVVTENSVEFSKRLKVTRGFPFATGLDIFPYDYLPQSDSEKEELYEDILYAIKTKEIAAENTESEELENRFKYLEEKYSVSINREKNIDYQINMLIEKRITRYSSNDAKEVAQITEWIKNKNKTFDISIFDTIIYKEFDNVKVPLIAEYDKQLSVEFGEYAQMIMGSAGHDFPYFSEQIEEISKKKDLRLEDVRIFEYNAEHCQREKCSYGLNDKRYKEELELQKKILLTVIKLLAVGDKVQAKEFLLSAQDSIISVGETIEVGLLSERKKIIGLIENYCELLYAIYQAVETGDNVNDYILSATEDLVNIQNAIDNSELERVYLDCDQNVIKSGDEKENRICFVFRTKEEWKVLKDIYLFEKKRNNSVYPIMIPYYEYEYDYDKGEMHYDLEEIEDSDIIYSYKLFDFSNEFFDRIYYSNSFEKYDWDTFTSSNYYSRNLQKISPEIVFVQCYLIDDFEDEESPMMYSIKEYVEKPGIIHADKILVNSKNMKRHFGKVLNELTGIDFDNKIFITNEYINKPSKTIRDKYSNKLLLYVNFSQLYSLKNKKMKQLENVLNEMKEYEIYVCQDSSIDAYLKELDDSTYEEYCNFITDKIKKRKIRMINSEEVVVKDYLAYVGDRSFLTKDFIRNGKKIYLFDLNPSEDRLLGVIDFDKVQT